MIELCIICHNFQRRWAFQLQSLVEQVDAPFIRVNVAYCLDNGDPTVEELIHHFSNKGLTFTRTQYSSKDKMPVQRGIIRNDIVSSSSEEYLFFIDCDLVYPPTFFNILASKLDPTHKGLYCPDMIYMTDIESTYNMVDSADLFEIKNAYNLSESLSKRLCKPRGTAIGGAQLVRRDTLLNYYKGKYCTRVCDNPLGNTGTRSDIKFRRIIAKVTGQNPILIRDIPKQIHLNHYRSFDLNYDINHQR